MEKQTFEQFSTQQGVLCYLKMIPGNNPEWNPKEKHQFFLAKSARLGSKNCHQKYILTIEQAQSIFEKYCLLLTTLLV